MTGTTPYALSSTPWWAEEQGSDARVPEGLQRGARHFLVGSLVFSLTNDGDWFRWDAALGRFVGTELSWDASTPGLVPVTEEDAIEHLAKLAEAGGSR